MRPKFRRGAMLFGLLAWVVLAIGSEARHATSGRDPSVAFSTDETTGTVAPISARRTPSSLALSLEQRARIFAHVIRLPDVPVADVAPLEPAASLPGSVALQDLPADVAQEIPQVRGYKFVKLDDRILLVSPASRMVVAEMPRYKLLP